MVSTATEANALQRDAFARMVTQEGLRTVSIGGYQFAGKHGKNGWELYRTYSGNKEAVPIEFYYGTDPAAGAECDDTVPTGERWIVEGLSLQLVCSADVANRVPNLVLVTTAGGRWLRNWVFGNITASQTGICLIYPGAVADTSGAVQSLDMGQPFELPAGARFLTSTTNIQAADNYAAALYVVRRLYV